MGGRIGKQVYMGPIIIGNVYEILKQNGIFLSSYGLNVNQTEPLYGTTAKSVCTV